jgi:glyceraldehyde 3-phosphate dehydrogenase
MVRVGVNGFGRIGRSVWRAARGRTDVRVVAVNDLTDAATLAHLLRYDSIRGRLDVPVDTVGEAIVVDGLTIPVFSCAAPGAVPWGDLGVDVVIESTGRFFRAAEVRPHLDAGAGRVLISFTAPDPDVTVVRGINDAAFDPDRHRIVSPGCCTSNAVGPVLSVLDRHFGVQTAHLTSLHSYDASHSSLHDAPYRSARMGRAGASAMVPSRISNTTGVLSAVLPTLAGRIDGLVVRVPVAIGCAVDLVVTTDRPMTAAEVNAALAAAARTDLAGIVGYTEDEVVSADLVGAAESCVVDAGLTTVVGHQVKLVAWYDNEWGFAHRLVELCALIGRR